MTPKRFYMDYETTPTCPALMAPPVVVMSFAWDMERAQLLHIRDRCNDHAPRLRAFGGLYEELLVALLDPDAVLVAHNAAFEIIVTMAQWPHLTPLLFKKLREGKVHCTMIRERQIRVARGDRREGFGLDGLCTHYRTGIVLNKECYWRPRYGLLLDTPVSEFPLEALEYSLEDIAVRDVDRAQRAHSYEAEYIDHDEQMRAGVALLLTSAHGFMTDGAAADIFVRETEEELAKHQEAVLAAGLAKWVMKDGEPHVQKDTKKATALLVQAYEDQGQEPPRGEPTDKMIAKAVAQGVHEDDVLGNIKLDEEACLLARLPLLESYTKFGQASTLLGKAKRPQVAARLGVPVQCRYTVLKATGRTSCSQGDDPAPGMPWTSVGMQHQNLPVAGSEYIDEKGKKQFKPGARETYVPRPGCAIVSVDMDAFEMRTWAQVCALWFGKDNCALVAILNDLARCPHVEMGQRLWAAQGKELTLEQAYALKGDDRKNLRGVAKGPNFGLPGGMGAARLRDYCRLNYKVDITMEQAEIACRVWREIYPEAQPYLNEVKARVGRKYGSRSQIEQIWSKRLRGDVGYTDAANGYFQALAADIAKKAGWRLVEQAYETPSSPLYGSRPLAFIHDEWLYEVQRERIHEAGHLIATIMTETAMEICPDVTFTAAPAAMYRWSKSAGDPIYMRDGKLVKAGQGGELICYEERNQYT